MDCMVYLGKELEGEVSVQQLVHHLEQAMSVSSPGQDCPLDLVSPWHTPNGCYTKPRIFEIIAAINRYRKLKTK